MLLYVTIVKYIKENLETVDKENKETVLDHRSRIINSLVCT